LPREKRGKVLGLVASSEYGTSEMLLEPGDRLLLYTDGIYEIFAGEKEFGIPGLTSVLRQNLSLPTPQLLNYVLQSARAFAGSDTFEDDVCLLAIDIGARKD
jgi:sigma-B regulation protein RsbU (phosphoserine phosphatase)